MFDVTIIGGGVAGIAAAITSASKGKNVCIIEKNDKLGKKLYATGNGKCNLTNTYFPVDEVYTSNDEATSFVKDVFGTVKPGYEQVLDFVHDIGLEVRTRNGYVYPLSDQASSVVWAMIDKLNDLKVTVKLSSKLNDITKKNTGYKLNISGKNKDEVIESNSLIFACGSKSAPKLGGDDNIVKVLDKLNIAYNAFKPGLTPLLVDEDISELSGVRNAAIGELLDENGNVIASEIGEVQFTDNALSGIMIFNLSNKAGKLLDIGKKCQVRLDLLGENKEAYLDLLEDKYKNNKNRIIKAFLNGFFNEKIASYLCEMFDIEPKTLTSNISFEKLKSIFEYAGKMTFDIVGTGSFDKSQASRGGVRLSEINSKTLELIDHKDIYVAGEMIDVVGICGGYNITFAMISGIRAGEYA